MGGVLERRTNYFLHHLAYLDAVVQGGIEPSATVMPEAFEMMQWADQSSAGAAVQQMGLRFAAGSDALSALVRERQDLSALWRDRDNALLGAVSKPGGQRNQVVIDNIRKQIAETEQTRRQQGTARTRVPGLCGAGKPEAAQGGGRAAIARWR